MNYKLFKIMAIMETDNGKDPVVFTFELAGQDEKSIGMILSKMDSIKKVISVEETSKPISEVYEN